MRLLFPISYRTSQSLLCLRQLVLFRFYRYFADMIDKSHSITLLFALLLRCLFSDSEKHISTPSVDAFESEIPSLHTTTEALWEVDDQPHTYSVHSRRLSSRQSNTFTDGRASPRLYYWRLLPPYRASDWRAPIPSSLRILDALNGT